MMKSFTATILTLLLISAPALAETPDPEAWFREVYAPILESEPWNRLDEMIPHYQDEIYNHHPLGGVQEFPAKDFLPQIMKEWRLDGWTRSRLLDLSSDRVHDATVVFRARWVDYYEGGGTEFACGWYVADLQEGRWRFSNYANIECTIADFQ